MSESRPIRIGNQTAFTALMATEPFEFAIKNGFDAFEWFPDKKETGAGWKESDLDAKTRRYIKHEALEHQIRLSVHTPWQVNPVQPGAWTRLLEAVRFAEEIGASLLNVHLYAGEGMGAYVQSIIPLMKRLTRLGIELSIENTPLTGPGHFNELFQRLRNLDSVDTSGVGMCLDVGHANLCQATRNDYLKFIALLDPQVPIIHIHIHENYGDFDSHIPLFTGSSAQDASGIEELARHLIRRKFAGCVILEQWPQPPALLQEARNKLAEILDKVRPTVEKPRKEISGRNCHGTTG
jgi:sugar phosphate isomerase/epimerase